MRISSSQIFDAGNRAIARHSADVVEAQKQISSGQKYSRASDGALAAGLSIQVTLDKAQFDMFKVNQAHLDTQYSVAETQIKTIVSMVDRFRVLVQQANSDTVSPENRALIAQELTAIKDSVVAMARASGVNGNRIFEVGSSSAAQVAVAPSIFLRQGLSESDILGAVGGSNVETILSDIAVSVGNGLRPSEIQSSAINDVAAKLTSAETAIGVLRNQLDAAKESADTQNTNIELERSRLLDTDLAEASATLVKSNALLQAAQSIMAKLDINNLFSKL